MADSNSTRIFLVYEYEQYHDSTRHLIEPAFVHLEDAKATVLECGRQLWEYMNSSRASGRYNIGKGIFIDRWRECENGELVYEFSQTDSVTLTGEWMGGWARWAIVPYPLKGSTNAS